MFHKVHDVQALPDFKLRVQFSEGVVKEYNLEAIALQYILFASLKKNPKLYSSVKVDIGGYGVVWNDDIDISCEELWDKGITIETPFDGLLSFSDATYLWELNESTLRKAITYKKLIPGIDVHKYGKQWVISMDAMRREYGDPKR